MHNPLSLWDTYGHIAESWLWEGAHDSLFGDEFMGPAYRPNYLTSADGSRELLYFPHAEDLYEEKSSCVRVGSLDFPNIHLTFTNGLNNSFKEAIGNGQYLSNLCGGCAVNVIHNASSFPLGDGIETMRGLAYMATPPVNLLVNDWNSFFSSHENGNALHYCHSQGAIHTKLSLLLMNRDLAEKIYVVNIEGAVMIPDNLAGFAINYVNDSVLRDCVPYLYDIFKNSILGASPTLLNGDQCNIIPISLAFRTPSFDHAFSSPTYKDPIQIEYNNFIDWGKKR